MNRRPLALTAMIFLIISIAAWRVLAESDMGSAAAKSESRDLVAQLQSLGWRVALQPDKNGDAAFSVAFPDGRTEFMNGDQLAQRLSSADSGRGWVNRVLNISGPIGLAWVALGLLGQALFTGRMLVQWLASERKGRSVVPPAFWWMSLIGATMLLAYFAWRKDIIGILGQAFGWIVYIRNLHLLYSTSEQVPATMDPAPEPELEDSPSHAQN